MKLNILRAVAALPSAVLADSIANFIDIPPSDSLRWQPCYQNFTCANLLVPLDYANLSAGYTNIAFLKDDAMVQPAKDILLNPGGPGGSGVNYLRNGHASLREMFGPQHNIIGFDPRAVNNSGPHLDYYPCMGKPLEEIHPSLQAWCKNSIANGHGQYSGTVAVAQDLLNFIELRNEELGKPSEKARLSFFGSSYGTAIGTTFAVMYPDRIERMILDAVVDGAKYYKADAGILANGSIDVLEQFAPMCLAAGSERCRFHGGNKTIIDIETRIEAIFQKLSTQGILASHSTFHYLLGAGDLSYAMFIAAYNPLVSFPNLAEVLVELEKGSAQKLLNLELQHSQILAKQAGDRGQGIMIQCLDTVLARSKSRLGPRKAATLFAPIQDMLREQEDPCKYINTVPPPSQQFLGYTETRTSFPILFMGTSADPVTPIRGAHSMSRYFPGSVVLKQDSIGHCVGSSPSICTQDHIRGYLAGKIPHPGTVCKPDRLPFEDKEEPSQEYAFL